MHPSQTAKLFESQAAAGRPQIEPERADEQQAIEGPARSVAPVCIRPATLADGAAIWRLVRASGRLDLNSSYAYLLLCDRFAETCLVAEASAGLVGFVAGLVPPRSPEVIFVWQIGVHRAARGQGIGGRLLDALLDQATCRDVRFLETTVTASNETSQRLFASFAQRHGASLAVDDGYSETLFPDDKEGEMLHRIGPLARTPSKPRGQARR